ncbi:hypothetical protein OK074_7075 [Actinobacteria bacterium OK074]|nr:hypothetical protein OK074_7075 [Actinobacteria bacterium OK074]
MSASPVIRSIRAAVFAVVCVLLAAGGHALATGAAPPVWIDGTAVLPVFAASYALGDRERSLTAIAGAMLTVQAALHLAFDAATPRTPAPPATHPHTVTMPPMPGMPSGFRMVSPHAALAHALTAHAMAAHLVAALLAAWCLRCGEAALWTLLRKAAAFVPGLVAWWRTAPLPSYAETPHPCTPGPPPPTRPLLRHALSRRGPPTGTPYAI